MITKQEFISKIRERERLESRTAVVLGILMVAGLFGIAFVDYARTHGYLGWSGDVDVMKVFLVIWLTALVAIMIGLGVVNNWQRGVPCPHCKKQLSAISAEITIATGFCGLCGEQVFEQSFKKAE